MVILLNEFGKIFIKLLAPEVYIKNDKKSNKSKILDFFTNSN